MLKFCTKYFSDLDGRSTRAHLGISRQVAVVF